MTTKRVLVPLTKGAWINSAVLQAAVKAIQPSAKVRLRVAVASDAHPHDVQAVRALRQQFPHVLPEPEMEVDLAKPKDTAHALEGCDSMLLSTGVDNWKVLEMERALLEGAKGTGVNHVVKVSCPSGMIGNKSGAGLAQMHARIEQEVREQGFAHAQFVRPNTSMQAFLRGRWFEMVCGRTLSVSVKNGAVAFVDERDVAESVCKLLLQKPPQGTDEFDLTGPEALTFERVAKLLTQGIGQNVRYSYFPLWAVQPAMWIKGARPESIMALIEEAKALEYGAEGTVTSTVSELLGKPARSFEDFAKENAKSWPLASFK
ncbi:TPA: hypothetical protein N0F65_007386 [Lagenidium giganteum]|uniref:NmrA-like domain-containing protein n=1 Tax=Lagenidium giganteum TaxID=4803 RepID=A0AAV2YID3_9STRA|nr:TPA: hypothetical protein N0F65_007386 [Lagenidium giganteum]